MTPEQAALFRRGNGIVTLHIRGDVAGRDLLVERFVIRHGYGLLAEAFTAAAIVAIEQTAARRREPFHEVLRTIQPAQARLLIPSTAVPWQKLLRLIGDAKTYSQTCVAIAHAMDGKSAANASFQLAVSVLTMQNTPEPLWYPPT